MICVENQDDSYKYEILLSMWDAINRGYTPTYVNASQFASNVQLDEWIYGHKELADILFYPINRNVKANGLKKAIPYETPILLPQVVRDALTIKMGQ